MMKKQNFAGKISTLTAWMYLLAVPVWAGGYSPAAQSAEVSFPESDGKAGVAALVVFGVIFAVGIIQIATRKWRDRGDGDKG